MLYTGRMPRLVDLPALHRLITSWWFLGRDGSSTDPVGLVVIPTGDRHGKATRFDHGPRQSKSRASGVGFRPHVMGPDYLPALHTVSISDDGAPPTAGRRIWTLLERVCRP